MEYDCQVSAVKSYILSLSIIISKDAWLGKLPNNLTSAFHKHVVSAFDSQEQIKEGLGFRKVLIANLN